MKSKVAIIILSYNSDYIIKKTILSAKKISGNVILVDSFSTDKTLKIAKSLNCKIIKKNLLIMLSKEILLLKNIIISVIGNCI